jgi:hypothetical protein
MGIQLQACATRTKLYITLPVLKTIFDLVPGPLPREVPGEGLTQEICGFWPVPARIREVSKTCNVILGPIPKHSWVERNNPGPGDIHTRPSGPSSGKDSWQLAGTLVDIYFLPRLAIYTKGQEKTLAFKVYRESWQFPRKRIHQSSGQMPGILAR